MKKDSKYTKCISDIKELQAHTEQDKLVFDVNISRVFINILELGYHSNNIQMFSNIKNIEPDSNRHSGINSYHTLTSLIVALKDKNKLIPWYGNDIISLLMKYLLNPNSNNKPAFPCVQDFVETAKCTNKLEYLFPKDAKLPRTNIEEIVILLSNMHTKQLIDTLYPLLTCVVTNEPNT